MSYANSFKIDLAIFFAFNYNRLLKYILAIFFSKINTLKTEMSIRAIKKKCNVKKLSTFEFF